MRNGKKRSRNKAGVYKRALRVLARMRRTGWSLTSASHEEQIDPRTVRKYLGAELRGLSDGQVRPSKADRRRRNMLVPTSSGAIPVVVHGSTAASQLGRYMSAVGKFLRSGSTDALNEFEGQSIAGHSFITNPGVLTSLAQAGALQLDDIYASPESSL